MLCLLAAAGSNSHPHSTSASWRETFHVLFCFKLPPRVAWFKCPVKTGKTTRPAPGTYDHIWKKRGLLSTPCDVTWPQILVVYNQEVWKPRGTILVVTCCRNRCPIASRNFFVWQVSLRV